MSETSAVNLRVGWWLFACSMNFVTSSLFILQIEFDSTFPIKMLEKATAILVPMAVPCV